MAGYGYTYRGSYMSEQVCQSAFSNVDGRRKPVTSNTSIGDTEWYVTKTEMVEVPFVTGYKQRPLVEVQVLMEYGDGEGKWHRPSSPEKWRSCSSPVRYHAKKKWNRPQGEDPNAKNPTEASRPNNPQSAAYWRQAAKPLSATSSWSIKEHQEPNGYAGGAWAEPSYGAWSAGQGANLSNPTSDINTAVKQPSSGTIPPPYRFTIPASTGPKRDTYPETIDSREAERRYGSLASRPTIDSREAERRYSNLASRPTITIDSTEAAKIYGGIIV